MTVTVINSSGKAVLVRADGEEVLGSFAAVEGSTPKISIETETGCAVSSVTLTDSATGKQTAIPYTGEPLDVYKRQACQRIPASAGSAAPKPHNPPP